MYFRRMMVQCFVRTDTETTGPHKLARHMYFYECILPLAFVERNSVLQDILNLCVFDNPLIRLSQTYRSTRAFKTCVAG